MHKFWAIVIVGLLATFNLQAEFTQPIYNFEVSGGYQLGDYKWAIAGIDDNPYEAWRQKFNNVKMYRLSANMNYTTCNNYYIRVNGNYGKILQGSGRVTGYAENDSDDSDSLTQISKIRGEADKGFVYDLEACVGYQFTSNGRRFLGTPVIGWGLSYQHFKMDRGHQELEDASPSRGHRSVYKPRWWGPFVGFDWILSVDVPCFLIFGKADYFFCNQYRDRGSWNLGHLYSVDFRDRSKGTGMVFNLGCNYKICNGLFVGLLGEYRKFHAGSGKHMTGDSYNYLSSDDAAAEMPIGDTKLRYSQWKAYSIELTLDFRYWADM